MKIYQYALSIYFLFFSSLLIAGSQAVILQYHHVDHGTPASTSITPELFDQHIQYIQDNGYTVWPLEDAVMAVRNRQSLPDKTVVITIDDAYRSAYTEVYPRMKKLGWPFTVFTNPDATDNGIKAYLTWDEMREMQKHGASFANHTHSHTHLLRLHDDETQQQWLARIRADIDKAQTRLKEELGQAPMLLAYPYGEHNPEIRKLITDMGYIGFGQQSGPMGPLSDFAALPRFPMAAGFAAMKRFPEKLNTRPLPVISAKPHNPVLEGGDVKPRLELQLADGSYQKNAIACYISGQGKGRLQLHGNTLVVEPLKSLPAGRSRYNCTAPDLKSNAYFWYSYAWFKRKADGSWYPEY